MKPAPQEPGTRFIHLDALRGIAALTVVLFHYWHVFPESTIPPLLKTLATLPGIRMMFGGAQAVMVFFVLSGYVLSLPYHRGRGPSYRQFAVRRVFRIYVPYVVAISVGAALMWILGSANIPKDVAWHGTLTGPVFVDHAVMLGRARYNFIDPPVWSLIHEMRISLIFPFLVVLFAWAPRRTMVISLLLSLAAAVITRWSNESSMIQPAVSLACSTLQYVVLFVLGIALARYADQIKARLANAPWLVWPALGAASYLLFDPPWGRSPIWLQPVQFGLAAALLIALVSASAGAAKFLSNAVFAWLGRISYSLYLLHVLVLCAALETLGIIVGRPAAIVAALVGSLVVAHVSYLLLERPCINLGRRLTNRPPRSWRRCAADPPSPPPLSERRARYNFRPAFLPVTHPHCDRGR